MGVMTSLAPVTDQPPLIFTPHPITLEGQKFIPARVHEGETLRMFLDRNIDLGADAWEVRVGGVVVPVEMWDRVRPKHGHVIEVRGAVKKQALYIVAMIALTYFTMGAGAAWAGALGATGFAATAVYAGAFIVGAMVINKVLGPKPPKVESQDRESVYNLAGARNALRPHEPLGLLLGSTRIAPDIISMPYSYYRGNDQYLAMVLTPGINVDRFDELYFGDTPLSSYEGVQVWTSGFPGMPEQVIPLYSNADTVAGGELSSDTWVERTTPADTVRVMVNLEYLLFGIGTSGKAYDVVETVQVEYRPVGASTWGNLVSRTYSNRKTDPKRDTLSANLPRGQYDIRVKITGTGDYEGDNTHENKFTWSSLVSVQADDADYRGIPRIGIEIKATGQLNGTPDQVRAVMHCKAMPYWDGTNWRPASGRELSNPGALILQYARGYFDDDDNLIGGMGLPDSMIDIPALQAFMLHCEANGYTYDHWLQSPRSHREAHESMALAGFGQTTWAAGRLSVVWAADGQPITGVVGMPMMKKGSFDVDYTLVNAADGIEYTYFDRTTWQTATLRVPAPGVTVMTNPARLTGEGVTTEAHAAEMARYHLAQHLYQFKSIGYSTDLEHMTYRRLSKLALSHDMTQWGRSGRIVSASLDGSAATIELDEPVSAPSTGKAYIGLRVPGERVYRVFEVAPFTGESDTLTLADPWPVDAAFPGDAGNPAHDTTYIYDFKATPGYTVRVTSIEPESGLKGARVSVVPESPEFWTYVKTGYYQPPVVVPPISTRPVASNLVISEHQVLVGNVEYTELTATFDVTGHVSHCIVLAGLVGQPLEEVAQTATRTATWRIDQPGEYAVLVRPMDTEGNAGTAVSGSYITSRADTPPPVFDWFEVQELPAGVRSYQWGYYGSTMQAANLAGAEIRYTAGNVVSPVWEDMTVLGDGFFTGAFEMVIPEAGTWTFAIRARNTSGVLSTGLLRVVRTLQGNLGEVIDDLYNDLSDDLADLSNQVDVIAAQVSDITAADEWVSTETYPVGDFVKRLSKLYRALTVNTNKPPESSPSDWELVGNYSSLGEAVAASIHIGNQNTSDIEAESIRLDAVYARMPSGSGELATSAMVATEATARATGDSANAALITGVTARIDAMGNPNLLPNPTGDAGFTGWSFVGTSGSLAYIATDFGDRYGNMFRFGPMPGGTYFDVGMLSSPYVHLPAAAGKTFTVSSDLYVYATGPAPFIELRWFTAANVEVNPSVRPRVTGSGSGWGRFSVTSTAPSTAERLMIVIRMMGTATAQRFLAAQNLKLESGDIATPYSLEAPFSGQAAAMQAMEVEIDGVDNRLKAKHTVALDVNGYVSGTVSENDGTTSSFTIRADKFGIQPSTPSGERLEWVNGSLRIYDSSNTLRVALGMNLPT